MRLILALILPALAFLSPVLGQTASRRPEHDAKAEREIRRLEEELKEAWVRADTEALDRLLADDWTVTHTNGRVQTKAQFIDALKSGRVKFEAIEFDDVKVRAYRNSAVVTARSTNRILFRGQESTGQVRVIRVYEKRKGRWQAVADQATGITQQ
jgi:uncharacterized protein (TIGR02246 family)